MAQSRGPVGYGHSRPKGFTVSERFCLRLRWRRSFREATVPELAKLGFVEGRNLVIDARLAPSDQMPAIAAELVRSNPDAILAVGGEAIAASITASDTIPVVMYGADALLREWTAIFF